MYLGHCAHHEIIELERCPERRRDAVRDLHEWQLRIVLLCPRQPLSGSHSLCEQPKLTRLNSGARTFCAGPIMPSTSSALPFSFLNGISSPASMLAAARPPTLVIHPAHAHIAPATSDACTVCIGCLPGDHLETRALKSSGRWIQQGRKTKVGTHRPFMGCLRWPYTAATVIQEIIATKEHHISCLYGTRRLGTTHAHSRYTAHTRAQFLV